MSTATWTGAISSDWATAGNWTPSAKPTATSDVIIASGTAVATASIGTVHSIKLSSSLYFRSAGANVDSTTLSNTGYLVIDDQSGNGGSSVTVGGLFTNTGNAYIGNTLMSSSDKLVVAGLKNSGSIYLTGNTSAQALLNVTAGVAGFGTAGVLTGNIQLLNNAAVEFASGQISTIAANATLRLNGAKTFIEDATALGKNSALTGLASNSGAFQIDNGASVAATGAFANRGYMYLDIVSGEGGSKFATASTFTNTSNVYIGNTSLASTVSLTAASLVNTGYVYLTGNGLNQALLHVTAGTAGFGLAGVLSGSVNLAGNSAVEFAAGQIATVGSGATLNLSGSSAFIEDATALGKNSALAGLNAILGTVNISNSAVVTTVGSVTNRGYLIVDNGGGQGGSTFSVAAQLVNAGNVYLGNSSLSLADKISAASLFNTGTFYLGGGVSNQALLNVAGVAGFGVAGVMMGAANLSGNSAIEFGAGSIATIASGASLRLVGPAAFVENAAALGSNSALKGLTNNSGYFYLENQAKVSTSGALLNAGNINVDASGGDGASSLTTGGRLTNFGNVYLGNSSLTGVTTLSAAGLANFGSIYVTGAGFNQALLNVTLGAAGFGVAGVVSGTVALAGDSAVEFISGQITTVAIGGLLHLNGVSAFIEDSTATGANSALKGLANIAGTAYFDNSVTESTTGNLSVSGALGVDYNVYGSGQSAMTVAGRLVNSGAVYLGNSGLSVSDSLTSNGVTNTGSLNLTGNGGNQALMTVGGAAGFGAAGVVTGAVNLVNNSAIKFASGQITTVAALSQLKLYGANAYVEDAAALGANSALKSLSTVNGTFYADSQVSVTTTAGLNNSGVVGIDYSSYGSGGSTLKLAAGLTNSGTLYVGNTGLASADKVSATSLVNAGSIALAGNGGNFASLAISGVTINNGAFAVTNDTEELAGAVSGAGSFSLSNSTLQFDAAVGVGETVTSNGTDRLALKLAQTFVGSLSSFNSGDAIDAMNFGSGTTFGFVENAAATGGTLTLSHTGLTSAHIFLNGVYSNASFNLASDGATGTLVKFV